MAAVKFTELSGSDPATYTSSRVVGQLGVATLSDSGSITVESIPSGFSKGPHCDIRAAWWP